MAFIYDSKTCIQVAQKIHSILEKWRFDDILEYIAIAPEMDTDSLCRYGLNHFFQLEQKINPHIPKPDFTEDLRALCLVFTNESAQYILHLLTILGNIPERRSFVAKILLYNKSDGDVSRKRPIEANQFPAKIFRQEAVEDSDCSTINTNSAGTSTNNVLDFVAKKCLNEASGSSIEHPNNELKHPNTNINATFTHGSISALPSTTNISKIQNKQQDSARYSTTDIINSPPACRAYPERFTSNGNSIAPDHVDITDFGRPVVLPLLTELPAWFTNDKGWQRKQENNIASQAELTTSDNKEQCNSQNTEVYDLSAYDSTSKEVEPQYSVDEKMFFKIVEMFPDAHSNYIKTLCHNKAWSEAQFNEIADILLDSNGTYPKRPQREPSPNIEVDLQSQLEIYKELLPDMDPIYLEEMVDSLSDKKEKLLTFIHNALETRQYPTKKDYIRKQQISSQRKQYTTEFSAERFVELFPDPVSTFEDPNRVSPRNEHDNIYVKYFMRKRYCEYYVKDIDSIVFKNKRRAIFKIIRDLEKFVQKAPKKRNRAVFTIRYEIQNIPLLQELAYFEHKEEILTLLGRKELQKELERMDAKDLGLLQECSCCYDNEVMPTDILTCTGGCRFCRNCIKKGVEIALGEAKTQFFCFQADCNLEFSLQVLQDALPPKVFSKLAQKKALEEVKAAGIEDLEMCPFCDFANIPAPGDKLFHCLNEDCMKESCRQCKEPNHVPLRCDEVEKDEDVKVRTYIENKMSEALMRECWKCKAKFVKDQGCNKMRCLCGAEMCYICRKPVTNYLHFNGQGGNKYHLCPLYSDDKTLDHQNVTHAVNRAKQEVDLSRLKHDPSQDLKMSGA